MNLAQPQERDRLCTEIRRANVICVVYSDAYSCERVALFWLPFFRSLGVNVPIILCANKADLGPEQDSQNEICDEMIPVMQEYKEIESCIRCSAKQNRMVNEVFYLCQRAVVHPLAPLYDSKERCLKPLVVAALQRIFFLSDRDQDEMLNDAELQELQKKCFSSTLTHRNLDDIKDLLTKSGDQNVISNGITEAGFVLMHRLFAENGRHPTTWVILRKFGYTDSLSLRDNFLHPKFDVSAHCTVELSPAGYRFFIDLFSTFDKDNDGALNEKELTSLFAPTPGLPTPWHSSASVRNDDGAITLQGFIAQWSMITLLHHHTTLAYLAYLGFESSGKGGSTDALKLTKKISRTKTRRSGKVERDVLLAYVLGEEDTGKVCTIALAKF